MHSFIFSASFEFAFAAILFVFHQSQDLVPRSSHSLSWPPFWINFHSPWTNQSRDFCCVPGSSLLPPPYWKARRPWGRGWSAISVVLASHAIIFLPSNLSFPGWQRGMYIKWRILWTAGKNRHPFCVFLPRWNLFELAYHLSCAVMDFCELDYSTDLTIQ